MANKKVSPKPADVEIVDDAEPIVDETVNDGSSFYDLPVALQHRIQTLMRRRGPVGGNVQTAKMFLNGAPLPSDEDGWVAFANSLER